MSATFCHELVPDTNATSDVAAPVPPSPACALEAPLRPRLRPVRSQIIPEFKERMVLPLLADLAVVPAPRPTEAAPEDGPERPLTQRAA